MAEAVVLPEFSCQETTLPREHTSKHENIRILLKITNAGSRTVACHTRVDGFERDAGSNMKRQDASALGVTHLR